MRMKTRLSLTVDPRVTHRAKRYAQSKNKSLSALVEDLLKGVAAAESDESNSKPVSFSKRWAKQLKPARKIDPRYKQLAEKYELE